MHFLLFPPWPRELESPLDGYSVKLDSTFEFATAETNPKSLIPEAILDNKQPKLPINLLSVASLFPTDESISSSSSISSSYENESLTDVDEENFSCDSRASSNSTMVDGDDDERIGDLVLDLPCSNPIVIETPQEGVRVANAPVQSEVAEENCQSRCAETVDLVSICMTGIKLQQPQQAYDHQTTGERDPELVHLITKNEANKAEDKANIAKLYEAFAEPSSSPQRDEVEEVFELCMLSGISLTLANTESENISELPYRPNCPPAEAKNSGINNLSELEGGALDCGDLNVTQSTSNTQHQKPPRSCLSLKSRHICSTCHLYAPSSSDNFYLDAWLNQQSDFYSGTIHNSSPATGAGKQRKRVKWPSDSSQLSKTIVINRWIERGIHVYPHPAYARNYVLDDDQDEDEESDSEDEMFPEIKSGVNPFWSGKSERHAEKRPKHPVAVVRKQQEIKNSLIQQISQLPKAVQIAESICGDIEFPRDDWHPTGTAAECKQNLKDMQQENEINDSNSSSGSNPNSPVALALDEIPFSRSSSCSSLSSLSNGTNSSMSTPQSDLSPISPPLSPSKKPINPVIQPQKASSPASSPRLSPTRKQLTSCQLQAQLSQSIPSLQLPKKKYSYNPSSGTVIGGRSSSYSSEHEAAVMIRGEDPIKNRAMIENYWQF